MSIAKLTYRQVLNSMVQGKTVDGLVLMGDKYRIYESIVILLGISKHLYFGEGKPQKGNFMDGTIQNQESMREILDKSIVQGGDKSDFTLANDAQIFPVSVKAGENLSQDKTEVSKLYSCKMYPNREIIPFLVLYHDKSIITEKRKSKGSKELEELHKTMEEKGRIYDKKDVELALHKFQEQFNEVPIEEIISYIDTNVLNNMKTHLSIRLHQYITKKKALNSFKNSINKIIIGHKPRSGKSITTLSIISEMICLKMIKKCLFITSIPETLNDYMKTIHKYLDFTNLTQSIIVDNKNILSEIPEDFEGILFSSVQFLKIDKNGKKDDWLTKIEVDAIIIDESHYGGSTVKTNTRIFKNITKKNKDKILICISGTPEKSKRFYKINTVYEWTFIDENFMKNIHNEEIYLKMVERHGVEFVESMKNETLDKDYSNCPVPVLIRPEFPQTFQNEISHFNSENNTNLGLDVAGFFKLVERKKTSKKEIKYVEKFELEGSASGKKLLKSFLEWYISDNPNRKTVMTEIEETQTGFDSRISTSDNPLVFIMFLPKVGNLEMLQKTLIKFIKENKIWSNYRLAYSNYKSKYSGSMEYSSDMSITSFVDLQLEETKSEGKDGLILFLGDQGSLGITYKKCDVLFMMDDSKNIDYYIQRIMRAMTDDDGKKVGCIVDMNFKRSLMLLNIVRKTISKDKSIHESIYDLITLNIFHFNPKQYDFINYNKQDISEICSLYGEQIRNELTDETYLNTCVNIKCDELEKILKDLKNIKKIDKKFKSIENLDGLNKDIPNPGKSKKTIVGEDVGDEEEDEGDVEEEEEVIENDDDEEEEEKETNTAEFFKKAISLLCLLTRTNKTNTFKTMYESLNEEKQNLFMELLLRYIIDKEKMEKSNIKGIIYNSIMSLSLENAELIEEIKTIYSTSHGTKLRELIAKNLKPSEKDQKDHAEFSTPTFLVNDKISKVPSSFFEAKIVIGSKKIILPKIIDPCCGKATYLPPLFDKLFEANIQLFDGDSIECCKAIMTTSLYFCDINPLNVFITNVIMECHVQSYCGVEPDYKFNSYVGNALLLNIHKEWKIKGFNMVVGNPPYNDNSGNKGKSHILWDKFICKALDEWLLPGGYLLYVHPSLWRQLGHELFQKMTENQIHYLELHNVDDGLKTFKCATRYDWYLLEKVEYSKETEIKDEEGVTHFVDLREWKFIPNKKFELIKELIASNGNELLDVNYYRSNYGADKAWVSDVKNEEFMHPVVYSINKNNELSLRYSNINTKGHFGLSKFIFSNGAGFYCDCSGEYGLTQWSYCIYDEPENLSKIESMFRNEKFKEIVEALHFDSSSYNINIMKLFKKDIYKMFC
jgi:superfamily II DNA or RNA helicase